MADDRESRGDYWRRLINEEDVRTRLKKEHRIGVVQDVEMALLGMTDERYLYIVKAAFHAVTFGIGPYLENEDEKYVFRNLTLLLKQ